MNLSDYLGLITSWHSDKPRFMNTVAVLLQPMVDAQAMLAQMTADFDLDSAVGVQLDILGQWIGRSRFVEVPISGVFFSFNDGSGARTGFNQGVWLGKYEPTDAITALDDETYRTLLKLQAIANSWDGTLSQIYEAFNAVFPGVIVQDKGDTSGGLMQCDVLIPGVELSSLMLAVLEQDFPIKASGVHYNFIETTVSTEPLFAFNIPASDGGPFGGFNQGAWGKIIKTL
jgi:hypothetical protein